MSMRDDEKQGAAESARLKCEARRMKKARAAKLAAEGYTPTEIGCRLGVACHTVSAWLRAAGVAYRRAPGSPQLPGGCPA